MSRRWLIFAVLLGAMEVSALLRCRPTSAAGPFFQSTGRLDIEYFPQPSEAEQRIRRALDERVSLRFRNASLNDLADYLREVTGENVYLDTRELSDLGVDPAAREINAELHAVPLRAGLNLLMEQVELGAIVHNGMLYITSYAMCDDMLFTRVYPVSDLISYGGGQDFDPLIELIENTIEVDSWDPVGPGTMQEFEATGVLVVNQTSGVHDQVLELLRGLRASRHVSYGGNLNNGGGSGSFFPAADRRATLLAR